MDVLGAWTEADEARGNSAEEWEPAEKPADKGEFVIAVGSSPIDPAMNKDLHRLD